jgi:pimeloyl-ACP methyl ester carboxylesterase
MTTTSTLHPQPRSTTAPTPGLGQGLRQLIKGIFILLGVILSLMLALPIPLLFIGTGVPLLISIILAIIDVVIIAALVLLARTPLTIITAFAGIGLASIVAIWLSQIFATTPAITGPDGQVLPNSIASLEEVNLNGSNQWISIRGTDTHNPVLLFLAGGPGGSELAWTRQYLGALEEYFVVVNWDQPGAGKSFNAVPIDNLTAERYINDAHALVLALRQRFNQDKIYLLGESWGSILGTWLVQRYPELFHAYVSSAQMVYTTRNDQMGYQFALDYAAQDSNTALVQQLEQTGSPPYDNFWTYAGYLNVLNSYMYSRAQGEGGGDNRLLDILTAPEYGLIDKVNWVRGLDAVFTAVYPRLGEIDFPSTVPSLDVPVYFIVGRWDVNAMASLTESYHNSLQAPHNELIWFEHSGHTPLYEESTRFVDVMVHTVLNPQ